MNSIAAEDVPLADADMLRACRLEAEGAWEQLVTRFERLVCSIPRSYGLPVEDALDIAQDTFVALLSQIHRVRDDTNLAAWLCTVARRKTWHLLHKRAPEALEAADDARIEAGTALFGARGSPEQRDTAIAVHQALNLLGARCRDLLQALYLDADTPSYADIASRLAMPLGGIGPTRARCLEQLRRQLEGGGP